MKHIFFMLALGATRALADWDGPSTPESRRWFQGQTNGLQQVCCDETEVVAVDDYAWRGDHFDVFIDGRAYHVDRLHEATSPNKYGAAVAWFYPRGARDDASLRCFMRGIEG